jgi:hypothetical protein
MDDATAKASGDLIIGIIVTACILYALIKVLHSIIA